MAHSHGRGFTTSTNVTTRGVRYFCHQCMLEIQPITSNADLTCPTCHGGFIEEMEPTFGHSNAALTVSGIDEHQPSAEGSSSAHMPGHHFSAVLINGGASSGSPQRRRLPIIFHGIGPRGPTTSGEGGPRRPMGLDALISLLGNFGGLSLPMPTVHGNPGDYVWGTGGLDAIITQLLNNVEGAGPPPADADKIKKLPTVKVTAEQVENNVQCFVCFDDFTLGEEVKVLPCKHHYHKDCIVPWLERHGTCPVCRIDLNGSDTTTTEFDANIGETIGSIGTENQPDDGGDEDVEVESNISNNSAGLMSYSSSDRSDRLPPAHPSMRDDDID